MLIVAGLAAASALVGGAFRPRFSWADVAAIFLFVLVAVSAGRAVDRRPAINLAWEWGSVGIVYVLVRWLPRTRGESVALAGALAATAVAVSAYGLYQVQVELPRVQQRYLSNPVEALRIVGIEPGSPSAAAFAHRVLHSNEPYSTFALTNSLAGFLVGPLVVMIALLWDGLTDREGRGSRAAAVALAAVPTLAVLLCLTLTKSRSAYVGLAAALVVLAWRERRRVRPRTLALAAVGAVLVVAALATAGVKSGRLDREVLTEADKSFRYRREYWTGAWRAINESPRAYWRGFGPGNFQAPYLRHKLPEASEEIKDPHNLVLEVWTTAGVWAALSLGVAVALALWNIFRGTGIGPEYGQSERREVVLDDASSPPRRPGWLVAFAEGGWVAVLVVGQMRLISGGDFERWLILGAAWGLALACGLPLWRRRPLQPAVLGAAAVAVLVNLLAAGGISVPAVALALWVTLAVGLNLREDRGCGRLRGPFGRTAAFGMASVWVALLGTFVGAVVPFWRAEAAMAAADDALRARPPQFDAAESAYQRAAEADHFLARPWMALANLEYQAWMSRGGKHDDLRWKKIPIAMFKAVDPPRPPDVWERHLQRARMTGLVMRQLGSNLPPLQATRYRADIVHATRRASQLYPTLASLRARLAEASGDIGMTGDAATEGRKALALDAATPHPDKKLEPAVRLWLESRIPDWERSAAEASGLSIPKPRPRPR